jgi:predicted Zn-dependent peptidase
MSYSDLAHALEQGAATCTATASPLTQSVSQYNHLCRNIAIGSSTMTKPNSDIQKLQAVTTADIQRVMKKYFTDKNRVVIYYSQAKGEATK